MHRVEHYLSISEYIVCAARSFCNIYQALTINNNSPDDLLITWWPWTVDKRETARRLGAVCVLLNYLVRLYSPFTVNNCEWYKVRGEEIRRQTETSARGWRRIWDGVEAFFSLPRQKIYNGTIVDVTFKKHCFRVLCFSCCVINRFEYTTCRNRNVLWILPFITDKRIE